MKLKTVGTIFGVSAALLFTGCGENADKNNSVTESVSSQVSEDCVTELSDNKEVKRYFTGHGSISSFSSYAAYYAFYRKRKRQFYKNNNRWKCIWNLQS